MSPSAQMPDIANESSPERTRPLSWVGMSGIDLPCSVMLPNAIPRQVLCKASLHVDIAKADQRGIHMSRLYLELQQAFKDRLLGVASLKQLLDSCLSHHAGISRSAVLELDFDLPVQRSALLSANSGWHAYPIHLQATLGPDGFVLELATAIKYSSTCPCSAALSRQLLEQAFQSDFADQQQVSREQVVLWLQENGSLATPHSQRSTAQVRIKLADHCTELPLEILIDQIESALQTAVQTAVKREDEQAFAELNGRNQMFCEDAARRTAHALDEDPRWQDFWLRIEHHESLHAHDATAVSVKGVPGGYSPLLHR